MRPTPKRTPAGDMNLKHRSRDSHWSCLSLEPTESGRKKNDVENRWWFQRFFILDVMTLSKIKILKVSARKLGKIYFDLFSGLFFSNGSETQKPLTRLKLWICVPLEMVSK